MATPKSRKESKISRIMKYPMKAMYKARDFYIDKISACAGRATYGVPMTYVSTLPKSYSMSSVQSTNSDADFRELVKASSVNSSPKVELEILRREKQSPLKKVVDRSQSVVIGRIDEDVSCEFGADVEVKVDKVISYSKSRSYAVRT